jgi:hypothetical protein
MDADRESVKARVLTLWNDCSHFDRINAVKLKASERRKNDRRDTCT